METTERTATLFRNYPEIVWSESLQAYVHTTKQVAANGDGVSEELRGAIQRGDLADTDADIDEFSEMFEFSPDYSGHFAVERDAASREWVRAE